MARKAGKGESTKTETLTVRINPKIKYGLELQARKQHRTLAGVVEWAIERGLKDKEGGLLLFESIVSDDDEDEDLEIYEGERVRIRYLVDKLWDTEESRRLLKLAEISPDLMTYEEQKLWGLIKQNAYYWYLRPVLNNLIGAGKKRKDAFREGGYCWRPDQEADLLVERVNKDLPILKQIVEEKADISSLPAWLPANDSSRYGGEKLIQVTEKEKALLKIDEEMENYRSRNSIFSDIIQKLKQKLDQSDDSNKEIISTLTALTGYSPFWDRL